MPQSPTRSPLLFALYLNAALFAAILVSMLSRGSWVPTAAGQLPSQPVIGNGNLYIMPGQLLMNTWGCYLLDTENQTLCSYAFNGNQLKLIAARNIRYDHQLGNYNTHPDPEEIRRLVEIERDKIRGLNPMPAAPATREAPK